MEQDSDLLTSITVALEKGGSAIRSYAELVSLNPHGKVRHCSVTPGPYR